MQLNYAFLADAVETHPDGKFSVLGGGVGLIYAQQFPAIHPTLALIIQLAVTKEEADHEHELRLELLTPLQAAGMPPVTVKFTPKSHPDHPDWPVVFLFTFTTSALIFETPGAYVFRISVDNAERGTIPLLAAQQAAPEGQASAQGILSTRVEA
jgi:hypothetical protein